MEAEPLPVIVRGEGVYLYDLAGRRYFDAISSWWCCNLGHGHPRLVEAIVRQARELQHSILGNLSHPRAVELAAALASRFRGEERRVLFASDGASAVEAALKIAVQYWHNVGRPERRKFVSLRGAYHGDTLGAVSVGFLERFHEPFRPLLFETHRAPAPYCAACEYGGSPDTCGEKCFDGMREIFAAHGRELAAAIVEPMCQGAGGMRIHSPGYLKRLAAACAESGALLIADEIAVGFGRTGRMFAFEHAGIDPDIVCLGKALSGGYLPISATVARKRIYDAFGDEPQDHTFYHGHTYAGNPIAAAAAVEALRVYEEERIVERAARTGRALESAMRNLAALPGTANVRCLGMIGAVDLTGDERQAAATAWRIQRRLLREGILLRPLGNVLYFMPPLIASEEVVRDAVARLGTAIGAEAGA
jgi:adenosylmethionine-8-amino-7-oxononanoate aminotransferase